MEDASNGDGVRRVDALGTTLATSVLALCQANDIVTQADMDSYVDALDSVESLRGLVKMLFKSFVAVHVDTE